MPEIHALRQPEEQQRTSQSLDRCQPPTSQNQSPMRTSRPEYHTTFIQTRNTPLHLRGDIEEEGFGSMRVEGRQDSDNRSLVSELDMGSLKANPHWHPSRDPTFIPFVPPTEIIITTKEPIREESADAPAKDVPRSSGVVGGTNPVTGAEFVLKDHHALSKQAKEDHSSFNTNETDDILSDSYGSTETMLQGQSRKGLLRREISHKLLNKVNLFKRRSSPCQEAFRVQSRSGCMV